MGYLSWRDSARPIIARVLERTKGQDEKAVRKALLDAYPFGQRKYHPYKTWLSEIAVQQGRKKLGMFGPRKRRGITDSDERQSGLFS